MNTQQWTSVAAARAFILSQIVAVDGAERVPLREALGRVLAKSVSAPFNIPGHDNSAMDGYACRHADLTGGETVLRVVGKAFAGAAADCAIGAGECMRIMTGARMPANADIVVAQEETRSEGGSVVIAGGVRKANTHVRYAGEDLAEGALALAAGTFCHPAEIGLLGALGTVEVAVKKQLRVAFFSTGDELKSPGDSLRPGEIYDSNRHTIAAMLQRMGVEALDFGVVADRPEALSATMDAAVQNADAVIASGGASVGEADFIRPVLAARGKVLFWKVAMRPGRPLAFGKLGGVDFFGLPGNPVSVMVCFYQFVQEALWRRAGRANFTPPPWVSATATAPLKKSPGRTEYQRGILQPAGNGGWQVASIGGQGSGILSSMTRANCFIVLEESRGNIAAGELVQVQPFAGLV